MTIKNTRNPIRDIPHYLKVFQTYLGLRMYVIFGFMLLSVMAEGVGLLMLLPLLAGLDSNTSQGKIEDTQTLGGSSIFAQDLLKSIGLDGSIAMLLLIITAAFVIKGTLLFCANGYAAYFRGKLVRDLKEKLFDHYSHMRYQHYVVHSTGHFVNVINAQIHQMVQAFDRLTQLVGQAVNALIYIGFAFAVAWRFGLMALGLGVVFLVLFRSLSIHVRELSRQTAAENGRLAKLFIQFLQGFKYLTATGQTQILRGKALQSVNQLASYQIRSGLAEAFINSIREPITVVLIMSILLVQLVVFGEALSPILVAIILFYRAMNAMLGLQSHWQSTLNNIGAVELVHQEFQDQAENAEIQGAIKALPFSKEIVLKNISFAYDPLIGNVIQSVSLTISARTSVAFVGESGAGKSTLVDILNLLLTPQQGDVQVDGISGSILNQGTWREQIGYVSQDALLFDDSIANNICMWEGDPIKDPELMSRIQQAAKQAHINHFIETLPKGYQTVVGDRGIRLSGGQRQRLFIARELFRKPSLLILDEATSALDTESERYIQESIDHLKGQVTLVIIAHRLSTIRNVNCVYVFDKGMLVEQGTFEALRKSEASRFARLVEAQTF